VVAQLDELMVLDCPNSGIQGLNSAWELGVRGCNQKFPD